MYGSAIDLRGPWDLPSGLTVTKMRSFLQGQRRCWPSCPAPSQPHLSLAISQMGPVALAPPPGMLLGQRRNVTNRWWEVVFRAERKIRDGEGQGTE